MIKNYLLVSMRNLMRHKFYSLLNTFGLAIGIACALLSVLYVDYHYRFDRHHEKLDRIYQVIRKVTDTGGTRYDMRTKPVAPALAETFPEIEQAVRIMRREIWVHRENRGFTVPLAVADKNIFDVFNIPLAQGDAKTGLDQPNSAFLSEKLARNLFGESDPIGQTVSVNYKWLKDDYIVTGILKDYPQTSNLILQFDFLTDTFSDKSMSQFSWRETVWERWPSNWFVSPLTTYLLLKEGTDAQALEDKLHPFAARHQLDNRREDVDYYLQPLSRVHLYSKRDYGVAEGNHGDITRCVTLLGIGFLVLTIACVNYINLVTARSANRVREVGMRKVVGAVRSQLMAQFLGESILVTLIACLFAIVLAQAALPFFNLTLESQLKLTDLSIWAMVMFPMLIVVIVGVMAGSYPALVLSAFSPVRAVKGMTSTGSGGGWLRKGLVILQFGASVILIISTLVVYQQTNFMRTKDLGFHRERVVVLSFFMANRDLWKSAKTIKNEILTHANVGGATITLRKIYAFFAGLSIFIGCLGMLGLIAYTAQQRTKEIGVRKVLGAPVSNLVILLSRDFLILAVIANLIAWPIAYWLSASWLDNFAYRINLEPALFIVTGLLTLIIVFMTVGGQAWRAARQNPVNALRYE